MATLPSGTVTFLFTDIEGSTSLLNTLGASYERLLDDQRRLLTEAVEDRGGQVVDRAGDALFAAFERAGDAVAAAVQGQRAIDRHEWPGDVVLRIRMGLHSGEPSMTGDGFVGLSVHKAARICAAAHGGQVLLSGATVELVRDHLPDEVILLELGEHRLKDFDRPEQLTQLLIGSLPAVLTPIRTVDSQPDDTPFAGHEAELAAASEAALAVGLPEELATEPRTGRPFVERLMGWTEVRRGRRGRQPALESAGMRLYAASRIAPDEALRRQIATLGGAVAKLSRAVAEADSILTAIDRKALERRLADAYRAPVSEQSVEAAEAVVQRLAAADALAEKRREFTDASRTLEARLAAVPDQVFRARLEHTAPPELGEEVTDLLGQVEAFEAGLGDARGTVRTRGVRGA